MPRYARQRYPFVQGFYQAEQDAATRKLMQEMVGGLVRGATYGCVLAVVAFVGWAVVDRVINGG